MVRIKHRYVIGQILFDPTQTIMDEFGSRDVINVIREKMQLLFGDIGAGEFGGNTIIKFYDANTLIFIVRTAREAEQNLRLAMATVTQIKRNVLIMRTLSVAGCGRTCLDKLRILLCRALEAEASSLPLLDESGRQKRQTQYETLLQTLEL